jgi:S-formylglutathione hydrolase FrmB
MSKPTQQTKANGKPELPRQRWHDPENNAPSAKEYRVWIELEEYDPESDKYDNLDLPSSSVAMFTSEQDARNFADRLQTTGEQLAKEAR